MNARAARVLGRVRGACSVLARGLGAAISAFDKRDALLLAGLALAAYGLALVWLPAAFIAPGIVLAAVAVFGVR
jgi:hypothetical protein